MTGRRWARRALVLGALASSTFGARALAQTPEPEPEPGERRHVGAVWLGLMSDWRLSERWSLWFDTHYDNRAFFVLRPGLTHHFAAGPSATFGYAYVLTSVGDGPLSRQEHRPWAQLVFPTRFGDDWGFSERLRAELRVRERVEGGVITDGWIVVPRLRAQTALTYWLARPSYGAWFLQPSLEILVNGGDSVGNDFLDQVRGGLMLGLSTPPFTTRIGYMTRFLPSSSPPTYEHDLVVWLNYTFERSSPRDGAPTGNAPPPVEHRPEDQNP